mmetsp:Transcript_38836/g.107931  ORF Transcript_38836/g.107931 Transcript_38836/m.107931 type:complete len:232 (+) Transcript_38836:3-698(+)
MVSHHSREPGEPMTLLLFPEGTDLSPHNLLLSQAFAKEKGLRVYEEVLHPKTAGFCTAMEAAGADAVLLDATIGYVGHTPQQRPNERDLFLGRPPLEVHVRLEAVGARAAGGEQLAAQCRELFAAKEERLSRFSAPLRRDAAADARPDVSALAEGCELCHGSAIAFRSAASVLAMALLEAGCWWTASRRARSAGLGMAAVVAAFSVVGRLGGFDALQLWHGRRFPAGKKSA